MKIDHENYPISRIDYLPLSIGESSSSSSEDTRNLINEILLFSRGRDLSPIIMALLLGVILKDLETIGCYPLSYQDLPDSVKSYMSEVFGSFSSDSIARGSLDTVIEIAKALNIYSVVFCISCLCRASSVGTVGKTLKAKDLGSYPFLVDYVLAIFLKEFCKNPEEQIRYAPEPEKVINYITSNKGDLLNVLDVTEEELSTITDVGDEKDLES